jgi:hypothetical protein
MWQPLRSVWAGCWWLTPVILATQEAEIRRIMVGVQPRQIVCKTYLENTHYKKNGAGGMAQGEGPEFKPQYCQKKEMFGILHVSHRRYS